MHFTEDGISLGGTLYICIGAVCATYSTVVDIYLATKIMPLTP
jgi:hypothetical protein